MNEIQFEKWIKELEEALIKSLEWSPDHIAGWILGARTLYKEMASQF